MVNDAYTINIVLWMMIALKQWGGDGRTEIVTTGWLKKWLANGQECLTV